jgi:hypothetical protein
VQADTSGEHASFVYDDQGVPLCPEPCVRLERCRLGVTSEHLDDEGIARFDLECPSEHDKGAGLAHAGWATSVLSEMAGHSQILEGRPAYLGTLSARFEAQVPVGIPLLGWVSIDSRERRKVVVTSAITSSAGEVLVTGSAVLITIDVTDSDA